MTLHESKHAGYTDLGRFHQHFVAEAPAARLAIEQAAPLIASVSATQQSAPQPGPRPERSLVPRRKKRRPQRALYEHADMGPVPAEGDCFSRLAELAEPENWAGRRQSRRDGNWVLREYVEWTFERLHRARQVATSADGRHSVFNTGLATVREAAIYGVFTPNPDPDGPPWRLGGWVAETDRVLLDRFPEPPGLASYTDDLADLVYDRRRELTVCPRRLLETKDSLSVLPGPLRSNPYQAGLMLESAVRRAEARVRRSHRAAVACWDPAYERVQLLLPLSLTTPGTVDLALVVSREGETYSGHTVLGLDEAYARARQIARPEEWLTAK